MPVIMVAGDLREFLNQSWFAYVLGLMLRTLNQGVVKFRHMGSVRKAGPEVGLKTGLLGICFGIDVNYVSIGG